MAQIDGYTKIVLTIIAVALAAIAARPMMELIRPAPVEAQADLSIPKIWGRLVFVHNGVEWFFEAADGTVRAYRPETHAVVTYPRK